MDNNYKYLLKLIDAFINDYSIKKDEFCFDGDITAFFNEAKAHHVHGIAYTVFKEISKNSFVTNEWKSSIMYLGILMHRNYDQAGKVLHKLRENNINVVALKGIVLKDYYKYPDMRYMSDIDILIKKEHIGLVDELLVNMGYTCYSKEQKKHIIYHHRIFSPIEIHTYLIDEFYFKGAYSFEQGVWNNLATKSICGVEVNVLNREYLILHIILHMICHFIHDGFGLRHLCDLSLIIIKEGSAINWQVVLLNFRKCNIEKFAFSVLLLCKQLFDINLPSDISEEDKQPTLNLLNDIISSGVFGHKTNERTIANVIVKHRRKKSKDNNKTRQIMSFLFPQKEYFYEKFPFTKNHIFLIPIAWIRRIFILFSKNDFRKNFRTIIYNNEKVNEIAKNRHKLLFDYGLAKNSNKYIKGR